MKNRRNFHLPDEVHAQIEAVAFVRGTTQSRIVEDAVALLVLALTKNERGRFDAVMNARPKEPSV